MNIHSVTQPVQSMSTYTSQAKFGIKLQSARYYSNNRSVRDRRQSQAGPPARTP